MKCPECGTYCWSNEVDVGVGIIADEWKCSECEWNEDLAWPMTDDDWSNFLIADDRSLNG